MWLSNYRTLNNYERICAGNRARSESRLSSFHPLNSFGKNSVRTRIRTKIGVHTKRSKKQGPY